jgi:hypothetical protein
MAEEMDPKIAAAYRDLGAEEPPRALDVAILAASRQPAAKPWAQRWAVPLSLAAVVVLSVTVTLRIQREAPELASMKPEQAPAPVAEAVREAPASLKLKSESEIKLRARAAEKAEVARAEPRAFADAAPASPAGPPAESLPSARARAAGAASEGAGTRNDPAREEIARLEASRRELELARREPGRSADSAAGGSALSSIEDRTARDAEAAARAPQAGALLAKRRADQPAVAAAPPPPAPAPAAAPAAKPASVAAAAPTARLSEQAASAPADTPEREFERIAVLRAAGRHDEADKAFLEFRRRYPAFRITEDMLRRVERPQSSR